MYTMYANAQYNIDGGGGCSGSFNAKNCFDCMQTYLNYTALWLGATIGSSHCNRLHTILAIA